MARAIHKLHPRVAERETKPGRHSDGGGLYLSVSADGRRRWVFLFTWRGRLREAGLGSASKGGVSLKAAREKAAEGRALVEAGVDPIAEWNKADPEEVPTFGKTADDFLSAHEGGWRNDKHKAQWAMTLTRYCEPIRNMAVDAIDTEAVLSVLKPLWTRAPETASRLRGRIETILDAAKARGFIGRNEANPARWRGQSRQAVAEARQADARPSCGYALRRGSGFRRKPPRTSNDSGASPRICNPHGGAFRRGLGRALGGSRLRRQSLDSPAVPHQGGTRASRSSDRSRARDPRGNESRADRRPCFPRAASRPLPLSGMAFEMLLRRIKSPYTAHGFQSAFRDWAGNETHFPRELAEHALAHVIGDKAEQAYRRSDALARRRELMDAWARHCEGAAGENVVAFKRPA